MDREEVLWALEKALDQEMEKPVKKWDMEKIGELTALMSQLRGSKAEETAPPEFVEGVLTKLRSREVPRRKAVFRRICIAAACLVLFIGADLTSHKVLGQGILPAGYYAVQGGIHTFLDGSDGKPDSHENIYYGTMKEYIDKYGLDAMIPTYIPKGFELDKVDETLDALRILFVNGNKKININYYRFNESSVGSFGFPTDTREVCQTMVNGHLFYTIREDNQLKAWCTEEKTIIQINTNGVEYSLADEVLRSME
ncbi:MAG TPA: DUF4367 domain-containing protein [Ruminococcus sp.]|nr:DUF4367 domain-containing protein [Ruminococcus sp.]